MIRPFAALLLLLPLLATATTSQTSPAAYQVEDPANDTALSSPIAPVPRQPLPANPYSNILDLRSFSILAEDENKVVFAIKVEQLRVDTDSPPILEDYAYVYAQFKLSGSTLVYGLNINLFLQRNSPEAGSLGAIYNAYAYLYLATQDDCCLPQPVGLELIDAEETIRLTITKAALMGREPAPPGFFGFGNAAAIPRPSRLAPGDRLEEFEIYTGDQIPCFIFFCFGLGADISDRLPDDGVAPPYVFQTTTANTVVSVDFGGNGRVPVQAGVNQTIPFTVQNLASGKRILQLQYSVVDAAGAAIAGFTAKGPPSITLPGGQARNFTFSLVAPASLPLDARVLVRGTAVGFPNEVAFAERRVAAATALTPASNKLYPLAFPLPTDPLTTAFCDTFTFCANGFLSADPQDPEAAQGQPIRGGLWFQDQFSIRFRMWSQVDTPTPTYFDASKPLDATFKFVSAVEDSFQIRATLTAVTDESAVDLWTAEATSRIASSGSNVALSGLISSPTDVLVPAGAQFALTIEALPATPAGEAAAFHQFYMTPGESFLALPLKPLPPDLLPSTSSFQLTPVGEREDFVNPGESRLFNVSLLNQGEAKERAQLAAAVDLPGWAVELLPGATFDLAAGDSITVGVRVHAPTDAAEGTRGVISLNVTDTQGAVRTLKLTATAVQIDVPDDGGAYAVDDDAKARVVATQAKKAPGPEGALIALALVGLALSTRRRQA